MKEGKRIHKHGGRSSQDILDPNKVLKSINLKEGDYFLDAGCGDGFISLAASQIVKDEGQVFAVDSYQESLDILIKKVQEESINNLQVIMADITSQLPLADDVVDLCIMANIFHGFVYNDEVEEAVSEIKRVLKSDGRLTVVEFKKIENTPGPPINHRLDADEVKSNIESQGFNYLKEMEVGPYHYVVIFDLK
jgi:ubiquinone/menaquinone biosynthesis C-methylase UbiE